MAATEVISTWSGPMTFINSSSASSAEFRRNKHLARKHVSKIIRHNCKRSKTKDESSTPRPTASSTESIQQEPSSAARQPLYSNLPPLSAALINTQVESLRDISRTMEYLIYWVSQVVTSEDASAYIAAFCEHPIIYHGLHLSVAGHQDAVHYTDARSNSSRITWHRYRTLRLLRQKFAQLDEEDPHLLIFAILCVLKRYVPPEKIGTGAPVTLPFLPHLPYADHLHIYGQQVVLQAHSDALFALIRRVGGVQNVKFPKPPCVAHDLIEASTYGRQPYFLNFYAGSFETGLALAGELQPDFPALDSMGSGFWNTQCVRLPKAITYILVKLAGQDRLMAAASTLRLKNRQYEAILLARRDVHYSVLSILPWTDLSSAERDDSSLTDYEVCRIVAALYSTAVIFPVSPQFPWLRKHLQSLHDLLLSPDIDSWLHKSSTLAIWALFIASIAAYSTEYFGFFGNLLREQLVATGFLSFGKVRTVLTRFIWSDNACEMGASIVWSKLNLQS